MKSILTGCLAALFLLSACAREPDNEVLEALSEGGPTAASEALAALVDEFFERSLELRPVTATSIGDDRYDDRYANYLSPDYIAESEALDREFLERRSLRRAGCN